MAAPRWLHDEGEIQALLNAALNRFDQLPSEARQRATLLPVEKHLPSLQAGGVEADQTWNLVCELATLRVLAIRESRRGPYEAKWHGAKLAFNAHSEVVLREWLQRPTESKPMAQWRAAVLAQAAQFTAGYALLLERRIVISGRSSDEVVAALATLADVKTPATLRQLSTHAFWGDSKLLDDRGDLVAALFPQLPIRERPIVVAVHLPAMLDGVLFIENQDTYTAAMLGDPPDTQRLALVYLSGFRATALRIRERSGARLHFAGAMSSADGFTGWWFGERASVGPSFFWGDLDFAGMQMLKSLRQRFGAVTAWPPGYSPMLAQLTAAQRGNSARMDRLQIDPSATGCVYADTVLLPAIREHGFWDQECIARVASP